MKKKKYFLIIEFKTSSKNFYLNIKINVIKLL
jgi:hypothetical protein